MWKTINSNELLDGETSSIPSQIFRNTNNNTMRIKEALNNTCLITPIQFKSFRIRNLEIKIKQKDGFLMLLHCQKKTARLLHDSHDDDDLDQTMGKAFPKKNQKKWKKSIKSELENVTQKVLNNKGIKIGNWRIRLRFMESKQKDQRVKIVVFTPVSSGWNLLHSLSNFTPSNSVFFHYWHMYVPIISVLKPLWFLLCLPVL